MRLGDSRCQMHVAHVPPADDVAASIHARDHVIGPGVHAVITVAAQECGVAAFLAGRVMAVIAVQLGEAAPA
ncbi:hypothetical protein G6F57_021140 [Rhizopus arrhizus]|nr:hypothetical protein G6F24_018534 [Rhizopus arrhizus]KAG1218509.1 hypothetical protein G6F68_021570 [Rhizopus microsporus]KAG1435409.1 hypothetical protein G6F57_021140 [Rhizopus arrhizus]